MIDATRAVGQLLARGRPKRNVRSIWKHQTFLTGSGFSRRLPGRVSGFYLMVQLGSSDDLELTLRGTDLLPICTDEDPGRAVPTSSAEPSGLARTSATVDRPMAIPNGTLIMSSASMALLHERTPFGRSERGLVGEGIPCGKEWESLGTRVMARLGTGCLTGQDNC